MDPGFAKGADHDERETKPITGVWGQSPLGGPGTESPKDESYLPFYTKEGPKVKDLNETQPQPAPTFGQWGGAWSTHTWIRQLVIAGQEYNMCG